MNENRASITAEAVCFWRALEAVRPEDRRALDDPYAHHFLSPMPTLWLKMARPTQARLLTAIDRAFGGIMNYAVLRHRWMDDRFLAAAAEAPFDQVLILGAGYDMRAWRLPTGGATVFEIDHPATAGRKAAMLRRHGVAPPPNRRAITVDFAVEDFSQKLLANGFDPARRSWAFWEGVTMYLPAPAVHQTLSALRRLGCRSVVDFFQPAPGSGLYARYLDAIPAIVAAVQEPLDYLLPIDDAPAALAKLGYTLRATADRRVLGSIVPGRPTTPCGWVGELEPL